MPQKFFVSKKRWSSYHTAQFFKSFHIHKSRCLRSNYIHMYYLSIQKHFNVSTKLWSICIYQKHLITRFYYLRFMSNKMFEFIFKFNLKILCHSVGQRYGVSIFSILSKFSIGKIWNFLSKSNKVYLRNFSVCGICPVLIPQLLSSQNQISSMQTFTSKLVVAILTRLDLIEHSISA
jgi:hypothetical protein